MQARIDSWAKVVDSKKLNHALMDLGSMICTPTKPGCLLCPLVESCAARAKGLTATLPLKLKSKRQAPRYANFYLLFDEKDRIAIRQRPEKGLWGGLWEIPNKELEAENWKAKEAPYGNYCFSLKHIFSHFDLNINVFEALAQEDSDSSDYTFIEIDKISTFAFARAVLRIFEMHPATHISVQDA